MTSTVIIKAHCGDRGVVNVHLMDYSQEDEGSVLKQYMLLNGTELSLSVFDLREVVVNEDQEYFESVDTKAALLTALDNGEGDTQVTVIR